MRLRRRPYRPGATALITRKKVRNLLYCAGVCISLSEVGSVTPLTELAGVTSLIFNQCNSTASDTGESRMLKEHSLDSRKLMPARRVWLGYAAGMVVLALALAGCAASATPTSVPTAPAASAAAATPQVLPVTGAKPTPAAGSGALVQGTQKAGFGSYLVDAKGMTLYMFTKDTRTSSACYNQCATLWPPFTTNGAPVGATGLTPSLLGTITRTDGKMQVTYNGHPLYYYSKDQKPGDILGQTFAGLWFVVSPRGNGMMGPYAPALRRRRPPPTVASDAGRHTEGLIAATTGR